MFSIKKSTPVSFIKLLSGALFFILLAGCLSRYRLDLFLVKDNLKTKVKVEQTSYVPGTVLGDPYSDEKVISGDGSTAVLTIGFRGKEVTGYKDLGLGFDEYLKYMIFLQLPPVPEKSTVELADNSFVQMLGHYELKPENKIFLPVSGTLVIDSVPSGTIYGTIDGRYQNPDKNSLRLEGRFKIKISY